MDTVENATTARKPLLLNNAADGAGCEYHDTSISIVVHYTSFPLTHKYLNALVIEQSSK
jgi:hypothetical protein